MFLRHTRGEWKTTMPEHLNMDWVESVEVVFDYFRERTPRSYVETRDTSIVWNYKYADVEFGRVQARDLLQHLWTGPISNTAVDVVQGGRSVEVRPVGVSKGAAIDRILGEIVHRKRIFTPIDYVLCIGHFLSKDEDIYTFFEPELPYEREHMNNHKLLEGKASADRRLGQKDGVKTTSKSSSKAPGNPGDMKLPGERSKAGTSPNENGIQPKTASKKDKVIEDDFERQEGSSVLDLEGDNYFSCAVGRKRSNARYSLASSEDVISFLKAIADSCSL
ncbi:hypothetical protein L7F22_012389 [Adiantum nelumboides]|nr:hypothetical protein [Adiantum nelumboides]